MAAPLDSDFEAATTAVVRHVVARYGVLIEDGPIEPPAKGDLDGRRILVGSGATPEERLFLVAHLFGHTVQWNTCPRARRLGMTRPVRPDAVQLAALESYEHEACRYSQQALHEAGVRDVGQWLADYSACDLAFLRHLSLTGERRPFRDFWQADRPLIEPLAIPPFTPRRWRRRDRPIVL